MRYFLVFLFHLLLASVPFSIEYEGKIHVELPIETLIGSYNIMLIIYLIQNRNIINWKNPILWGVFALFFGAVFSFSAAILPLVTLKALIVWSNYCMAFYGSWLILQFNNKEKKQLLKTVSISYGLLMLYAFVQYLHLGIHYQNSYMMARPFANGHTLLIAMGFPLWLLLSNKVIMLKAKHWEYGLWLFYTAFIYLSYSRFYWVIVIVMFSCMMLKHWKKIQIPFLIGSIALVTLGYFSYNYIKEERDRTQAWLHPDDHNSAFVQLESIFKMSKNESNIERINRWKIGLAMYYEQPFSGIGLNNYSETYTQFDDSLSLKSTTRNSDKMNAHQWYLGVLAEQGIIGVCCLLLFLGIWANSYRKHFHFISFLCFIHYLCFGIIEDFLLNPEVVPAFWLCLGWQNDFFMQQHYPNGKK